MAIKETKTRIVNKHDLEVHWLLATGFIPMQGELIVYDAEVDKEGNILTDSQGKQLIPDYRTTPFKYERLKVGDGKTVVSKLPFINPAPASVFLDSTKWVAYPVDGVDGAVRMGQVVEVANAVITENSKVDLNISSEQAVIFYDKSLAFVAENEDGVVIVYCIGEVPNNDYTIQVTVTEVG